MRKVIKLSSFILLASGILFAVPKIIKPLTYDCRITQVTGLSEKDSWYLWSLLHGEKIIDQGLHIQADQAKEQCKQAYQQAKS